MKIVGDKLVNRFYKKHGWTRNEICKLIKNKYEFANILRKIEEEKDYFGNPFYVVYDLHVIFDINEVNKHEYVPFSIDGHKPTDDDKYFEMKNTCE